jgi:hypothetical protein
MPCRTTFRLAIAGLVGLAALAGCGREEPPLPRLGAATDLASPAGAGSRFPHLSATQDGVVMSWLQPGRDGEFSLRHATYSGGKWSPAGTVAQGTDWFVNWADFPSVVPVSQHTWVAHWLQQRPGNVYSYDVQLATSADGGRTWSQPHSPHDDGTATEHGFVTLLPDGGAAQVVWLDGRHTAAAHDHSGGAMTLRGTVVGGDATRPDQELDDRTCDCCQTDAARTRDGVIVVYRDRSEDEIRDIAAVRRTTDGWSEPAPVSRDGWRTDACPVNGPAVDARGDTVAVAWFTAPDRPRVRLAFSQDGGRTFAPPIEVAVGATAGRVDTVLLDDGSAAVSWLADGPGSAEIRVQVFSPAGADGPPVAVARSDVGRSSGFPRMALTGRGLIVAWTSTGDGSQVRTAFVPLR